MVHRRLVVIAALILVAGRCPSEAVPVPQAGGTPAAGPAWKPFQEFSFVSGSWSGVAENSGRVGGSVGQFTPELDGNYFTLRVMRLFPQQEGRPEETQEEIGTFFYDRDKRRYVAHVYFSTGVVGLYDVETADSTLRLTSRELLNTEGMKSRITFARSGAGLVYTIELAPQGKDFSPFSATRFTRK